MFQRQIWLSTKRGSHQGSRSAAAAVLAPAIEPVAMLASPVVSLESWLLALLCLRPCSRPPRAIYAWRQLEPICLLASCRARPWHPSAAGRSSPDEAPLPVRTKTNGGNTLGPRSSAPLLCFNAEHRRESKLLGSPTGPPFASKLLIIPSLSYAPLYLSSPSLRLPLPAAASGTAPAQATWFRRHATASAAPFPAGHRVPVSPRVSTLVHGRFHDLVFSSSSSFVFWPLPCVPFAVGPHPLDI